MRLFISFSSVFLLAALVMIGCQTSSSKRAANTAQQSSAPGSLTPADGIRRVTTVELRDALEKGTAIVVDVRSSQEYKKNHIKGSLSIPANQITTRTNELPQDKLIVLYCS